MFLPQKFFFQALTLSNSQIYDFLSCFFVMELTNFSFGLIVQYTAGEVLFPDKPLLKIIGMFYVLVAPTANKII